MSPKPDFMIIGTQHSGTTWLWNVLDQYPETSFPRKKEIHFFGSSELYHQGLQWYFNQFDGLDSDKIICDAATSNFYDRVPYWRNPGEHLEYDESLPTIPELVTRALPDVKIIVSLRDPVSRAISAYHHWIRRQSYWGGNRRVSPWLGLRETALRYPKVRILEYGFYSCYLREWKKYIPEEHLCVLIFEEDMVQFPKECIKKVLAFLEIESDFAPETEIKSKNPSWNWTRILLNYYTKPMMRWIDKGPVHWLVNHWDPLKKYGVTESDIEFLKATYAQEKEAIESQTGRSLDCWRYLGQS
jgi:hypothetical protein